MSTATHPTDLLERAAQLETLAESYAAVAATSRGRLALVYGEAGIGKTALVRRFCDEQAGSARVLGAHARRCSRRARSGRSSTSPRATAPNWSPTSHPEDAQPYEVAAALMAELRATHPRSSSSRTSTGRTRRRSTSSGLIGRRIETAAGARRRDLPRRPARPRAPAADRARGAWRRGVRSSRLDLGPLSREPSPSWRHPTGVDPSELLPRTGGNPFFVTEALARGTRSTSRRPSATRCSPGPRASAPARGRCSKRGDRAAPGRALAAGGDRRRRAAAHLEECLGSGMLRAEAARGRLPARARPARGRGVAAADRRAGLHRAALAGARRPAGQGSLDLARLAHHAEAAGDAEAVLRFAPAAAAHARPRSAPTARPPPSTRGRCASPTAFRRGAGAAARAALVRVLPHRPARRGDRRARGRDRAATGRSATAQGGRALALARGRLWCAGDAPSDRGAASRGGLRCSRACPPSRELAMRLRHRVVARDEPRADADGRSAGAAGARAGTSGSTTTRSIVYAAEQHRDDGGC